MFKVSPSSNNLYIVETDIDVRSELDKSNEMMDQGEVDKACQLRYDIVTEIMDALCEIEDDIELNMNNADNEAIVDILVKSAIDHYFISDFETSAAICETVLELDPEDHFGATPISGFCYAGLQEWDSLEAILTTGTLTKIEENLLQTLANIEQGKDVKIDSELIENLNEQDSAIAYFAEPLRSALPDLFSRIK